MHVCYNQGAMWYMINYVIQNTAHRPSMQARYTVDSRTTKQRNQPAVQIAARHSIFPQMVLVGIDPGSFAWEAR